jgi:hypothetical protein
LVVACSALLIGLSFYMRLGKSAWTIAITVPMALSICIYWSPVWLGADPSQYSAWALIGIGVPFIAGALTSMLILFTFGGHAPN